MHATIESILTQDHVGHIDCLVVFDGVPVKEPVGHDPTGRAGPRSISTITNHRSPGLAGARNSGIEHADTELVAFCDDDDEWLPHKLRVQLQLMESSGGDVIVSGITVVYRNDEVDRIPSGQVLDLEDLVRRRTMAAHSSTVVCRRAAVLDPGRIGPVDEDIPGGYGEDYDFMLRAVQVTTVGVVREPLVRVHWGSSLFARDWETIVLANDYLIAKHPQLAGDRTGLARLRARQAFALAATGRRGQAVRTAWTAIRLSVREPRSYMAIAVAARLMRAETLLDLAHRRGRGI